MIKCPALAYCGTTYSVVLWDAAPATPRSSIFLTKEYVHVIPHRQYVWQFQSLMNFSSNVISDNKGIDGIHATFSRVTNVLV